MKKTKCLLFVMYTGNKLRADYAQRWDENKEFNKI